MKRREFMQSCGAWKCSGKRDIVISGNNKVQTLLFRILPAEALWSWTTFPVSVGYFGVDYESYPSYQGAGYES